MIKYVLSRITSIRIKSANDLNKEKVNQECQGKLDLGLRQKANPHIL